MTGTNNLVNGNGVIKTRSHSKVITNGRERHDSFSGEEKYTYEMFVRTANYLKERVPYQPKIGIICGSGLGSLAEDMTQTVNFPYSSIPNFPVSTVEGHAGRLVFGYLAGVPVVVMQGRFHFYEGYPLWKCAMPVRVMKLIGVSYLIATNAAGGLNNNYHVGDIMLVKDHINMMGFAGNNPLQGPNEERFGPRFPPMNKAYDKNLLNTSLQIAHQIGLGNKIHTGIYTCLGGPSFETVAELRALKMLGADAVGMSTVHEVITARHCDIDVLAFSLITNNCVLEYDSPHEPKHQEVIDAARMMQQSLRTFVAKIVEYIQVERIQGKKLSPPLPPIDLPQEVVKPETEVTQETEVVVTKVVSFVKEPESKALDAPIPPVSVPEEVSQEIEVVVPEVESSVSEPGSKTLDTPLPPVNEEVINPESEAPCQAEVVVPEVEPSVSEPGSANPENEADSTEDASQALSFLVKRSML